MAKRAIPSVTADFDGVWAFLKSKGVVPANVDGDVAGNGKLLHRATYSLILWRFRLRNLPECGQAFIEEIASDALQILPQCMMGYNKTTTLLIRGIIENITRHLYFFDHPVEFARMNREQKWYLTQDELFAYPGHHELLVSQERKFDAVNRLKTLYSELSAKIHGRRVSDLEMRTALAKIALDATALRSHVKAVEKCAEATNFLLASFHADQFHRFQKEDRTIILSTMCPTAKQAIAGIS